MMIGEIAALGTAVCWTLSAIAYKEGLKVLKPIFANIIRCTLTSLSIVFFLIFFGRAEILLNLPAYSIILLGISGILGLGIGDTLYMISLKYIGVSRTVPITCTYPLFTLSFTYFFQHKVVNLNVVTGAVLVFFGVWLISQNKEEVNY